MGDRSIMGVAVVLAGQVQVCGHVKFLQLPCCKRYFLWILTSHQVVLLLYLFSRYIYSVNLTLLSTCIKSWYSAGLHTQNLLINVLWLSTYAGRPFLEDAQGRKACDSR
jgi:hypothetical protein